MRHIRRVAILALALLTSSAFAQRDDIKACWIYIGPVGDYGYSYAHDLGRLQTAADLPGIETAYVEAVAEADVEATVDQLVADGCNVIFGTSFGFGDGILAAAERYPDVIFGHATGVERAPNVLTYMADFYQVYYLNGLIAGAITETNTVGYVAAFPIPEVKRHINAFALGVQEVNPDAKVVVRWIYNWFDPAGATEATEALIADGADVFAYTEDTPTVPQVAAARGLTSFSHYASMDAYAPETLASGQLVHWGCSPPTSFRRSSTAPTPAPTSRTSTTSGSWPKVLSRPAPNLASSSTPTTPTACVTTSSRPKSAPRASTTSFSAASTR